MAEARDGAVGAAAGGAAQSGAEQAGAEGRLTPSGRRPRRKWTPRLRAAFLDALAADCNVRAAARRADVSIDMIYGLRRRDDGFAAEWMAALQRGYEMVETLILGHVLAGGGPTIPNPDPALPPLDLEIAMKVLAAHHQRAAKGQPVVGRRPKLASREDTDRAVIRMLEKIERKRGLPPLDPLSVLPTTGAAA